MQDGNNMSTNTTAAAPASATVAQKIRLFAPLATTAASVGSSIIYHVWKENKMLSLGAIMLILYPSVATLVPILFDWLDEIITGITFFFKSFFSYSSTPSSTSSTSSKSPSISDGCSFGEMKRDTITKKLTSSFHSYDFTMMQKINNEAIEGIHDDKNETDIGSHWIDYWLSKKPKIKHTVTVLPDGRYVSDKYRVRRNAHDIIKEWETTGEHRIQIRHSRTDQISSYIPKLVNKLQPFSGDYCFPESFIYRFDNSNTPSIVTGHIHFMCFVTSASTLASTSLFRNMVYSIVSVFAVSKDFTTNLVLPIDLFKTENMWESDAYQLISPPKPSSFSLNKLYNEHVNEIQQTVAQFKAFSRGTSTSRKVCCNFCFAGPTGTSKTFAARSIASALHRTLIEVDLKKFKYENEFFDFVAGYSLPSTVFLLDEIDLMCPTRSFDDALLSIERKKRLSSLTEDSSSSSSSFKTNGSNCDDNDSGDEEDNSDIDNGFKMSPIGKFNGHFRKFNGNNFGDSGKSVDKLAKEIRFMRIQSALSQAAAVSSVQDKDKICLDQIGMTCEAASTVIKTGKISMTEEKKKEPEQTLLTLRTLLTWIAGPHTSSRLVVIATTNCPDKLAPELIRPGRLRLLRFENLRKVDLCQLLSETFPCEEITDLAERIGYQDYALSGATVEAIMSSCNTVKQVETALQRELL